MSIRLMSQIFEMKMPDIETDNGQVVSASAASYILLAIADHANDRGEGAYPSIALLAKKTKLSEQTVIKAVNALERVGFLETTGKSKWGSSIYKINIEQVVKSLEESSDLTGVVKSLDRGGKVTLVKPLITINNHLEKEKSNKKELQELALALSEVTGMSLEVNAGILFKSAKSLTADKRVSPALIRITYGEGGAWYQKDWRGKLGQKPLLNQVAETILSFETEPPKQKVIKGGVKTR